MCTYVPAVCACLSAYMCTCSRVCYFYYLCTACICCLHVSSTFFGCLWQLCTCMHASVHACVYVCVCVFVWACCGVRYWEHRAESGKKYCVHLMYRHLFPMLCHALHFIIPSIAPSLSSSALLHIYLLLLPPMRW